MMVLHSHSLLFLLSVLFLSSFVIQCYSLTNIDIVIIFTSRSEEESKSLGVRFENDRAVRLGYKVFEKWLYNASRPRNMYNNSGEEFNITTHWIDTYNATTKTDDIDEMMKKVKPWMGRNNTYFLGPGRAGVDELLLLWEEDEVFLLPETGIGIAGTDYGLSLATDFESRLRVVLPEMRAAGIREYVLMYHKPKSGGKGFPWKICEGIKNTAYQQGFRLISEFPLDRDPYDLINSTEAEEWINMLKYNTNSTGNETVIFCMMPSTDEVFKAMKRLNYMPDLVIQYPIPQSTWYSYSPDYTDFIVGVLPFFINTNVKFPPDDYWGTFEDYLHHFDSLGEGRPSSGYGPKASLVGAILVDALHQSKSGGTVKEEVFSTIIRTPWETFYGTFSWGTDHKQIGENIMVQSIANLTDRSTSDRTTGDFNQIAPWRERVIAPVLGKTAELVYPLPKWHERVYSEDLETGEIVILVMMLVLIAMSVIWMIFTIINWKKPTIRAASPVFLMMVLVGSIVLYLSVLTFFPHLLSDAVCTIRAWFLGIGFVILFGSLFAKSWRVHLLYSNAKIRVRRIPDRDLWIVILVLIGLEVAMLLVFTFGSQFEVVMERPDIYRRAKDYQTCHPQNQTFFIICLIILLIAKAALMAWGVVLSIILRGVRYRVYNEATIIAFSMYNIIFFVLLGITIQAISNLDYRLKYIFTCMFILAGGAFTVNPLFIQKAMYMREDVKTYDTSSTLGDGNKRSSKKSGRSFNSSTDDKHRALYDQIANLTESLDMLRKSVRKWKTKYKELKVNIDSQEELAKIEVTPETESEEKESSSNGNSCSSSRSTSSS